MAQLRPGSPFSAVKSHRSPGFSLVEVLVATTIVVVLFGLIFQLFNQSERTFRDQNLLLEMRQAARAAISQIADDIRIAGQGVPVHVASLSPALSESTVVLLAGSDSTRLQLRAGISNTASFVTGPLPVDLPVGVASDLTVNDATTFSSMIGTAPVGRYVFIFGSADQGGGWLRAVIHSISGGSRSLRVTPVDASIPPTRFNATPAISLEEAIAVYRDIPTGSIRRTTSTNMADPTNPGWAPANELAT